MNLLILVVDDGPMSKHCFVSTFDVTCGPGNSLWNLLNLVLPRCN